MLYNTVKNGRIIRDSRRFHAVVRTARLFTSGRTATVLETSLPGSFARAPSRHLLPVHPVAFFVSKSYSRRFRARGARKARVFMLLRARRVSLHATRVAAPNQRVLLQSLNQRKGREKC